MSTTTERRRRSRLTWLLRVSAGPLLAGCLIGGVLMLAGLCVADAGRKATLWEAGSHLLALAGVLFVALLWGGVYLQVVEASRGMPGLRPAGEPDLTPEAAAELRSLRAALCGLGFRHEGWFSLDDFDGTHVGAWRHEGHPAAAFVLYSPPGGTFRLRIVRRFPSGGVLVSSTRLVDLSSPPPQGIYVQARKKASAEELWAWHLEAEALFPDATGRAPSDAGAGGPMELYVGVWARWAGHWRRDRTWLLGVEPVGECWRMYHLCGMPLRRQFELGWTAPFWQ